MRNENGESRISTEQLLELLFKEKSLDRFMERSETSFLLPSFHEFITALCARRGEVPEHIIARANLEKSYGHKIFAGVRKPSRDTVLLLAFGFDADVALTQELLTLARKSALYPKVKRDTAIIYCLHNHISLVDTQVILHDLDLPLLGEGSRNE